MRAPWQKVRNVLSAEAATRLAHIKRVRKALRLPHALCALLSLAPRYRVWISDPMMKAKQVKLAPRKHVRTQLPVGSNVCSPVWHVSQVPQDQKVYVITRGLEEGVWDNWYVQFSAYFDMDALILIQASC
jgi:hypothetical protein